MLCICICIDTSRYEDECIRVLVRLAGETLALQL